MHVSRHDIGPQREMAKALGAALISRAEGATTVSTGAIVGAALGAGVAAFIVLGIGVWLWMRRQPRGVTSIKARGHIQSSTERGLQPLTSTASLSGEVLSDHTGRSGRHGQRGQDETTPSISKIRQHEFEPKPKRVQHEAKHARRSVLRRATQEPEHSEENELYSARQGHPNTFELAGWDGGHDVGSVNVRAWTAGVASRSHARTGSSATHGFTHARSGSVDPLTTPFLPRMGSSTQLGLNSSRPTTPKPSAAHSRPTTPTAFAGSTPSNGPAAPRNWQDGQGEYAVTPFVLEPTAASALSPHMTVNGFPLEKSGRLVPQNEHDMDSPYSPAPSPFSAGLSPMSAGTSAYYSVESSPFSAARSPRSFGADEKHRPRRHSRSRSASRSRDGHTTPVPSSGPPVVDLDPGAPSFLQSDPTEQRGRDGWSDPTQRPGYDPKRGTVLPSYGVAVRDGSSA